MGNIGLSTTTNKANIDYLLPIFSTRIGNRFANITAILLKDVERAKIGDKCVKLKIELTLQ